MKNIFNYSKYSNLYEIIGIIFVFTVLSLIFTGHYQGIFTDVGREMIIPEGILKGKVLYKDILCIYSPLAYLMNALGFKIFGINIFTLEFLGSVNACFFAIIFYFLSKEFFSRQFAAILTFTVIITCILGSGLFNFILPYSYSMSYGLTAYLSSVYLAVLYLKNHDIRFIWAAFLLGGYAFACKTEFLPIFFILFAVTLFFKPLNLKQNFVNLFLFLFVPLLTLIVLFRQGVTIKDLISATEFMKTFFTTPSMIFHITRSGGLFGIQTLLLYKTAILNVIIAFLSIYVCYFVSKKFKPFLFVSPILLAYIFNKTAITFHLIFLPILLTLFSLVKIKIIIKNPTLAIVVAASIGVSLRTFFALQISVYGSYAIPLLLIGLFALLKEFSPSIKPFSKEEMKNLYVYCLCTYSLFFIIFNVNNLFKYNLPIKTDKGTIFSQQNQTKTCNIILDYLDKYTKPEDKVLVLPEGTVINFLSGRPVDYKMHMVDRLYYDALGSEKVLENIKDAKYEVIIFLEGFGLTKFGSGYLYDESNPIVQYVKNNYVLYMKIVDEKSILHLYQKPPEK